MVRVLVAGFQHETNSFAATPAGWDAFELGDFFPTYSRGHAMLTGCGMLACRRPGSSTERPLRPGR